MASKNQHSRVAQKLTPTEISIAVAQICDRYARWMRAARNIAKVFRTSDDLDSVVKQECDQEAIPEACRVLLLDSEATSDESNRIPFRQLANWFVRGMLTKTETEMLICHYEEIHEIDWGWIFFDEPIGYYTGDAADQEECRARFVNIGTRAPGKKKEFVKRRMRDLVADWIM